MSKKPTPAAKSLPVSSMKAPMQGATSKAKNQGAGRISNLGDYAHPPKKKKK